MIGPHDVGAMMGFGPVVPEPDEPVFHADWERRMLGLTLCAGAIGGWNLDESRHARENRHPYDYYGSSYYEIWFKGLQRLLLRHNLITETELSSGQAQGPGQPKQGRVLTAEAVPIVLSSGGPTDREPSGPAQFSVDDRVRTITDFRPSHTRLPRYATGRVGTIESINGAHVFPDTNALHQGENPQWLYTVAFTGTDLWGPNVEGDLTVSIDAWEPYLEPANNEARPLLGVVADPSSSEPNAHTYEPQSRNPNEVFDAT